jgi:hypothetical protein
VKNFSLNVLARQQLFHLNPHRRGKFCVAVASLTPALCQASTSLPFDVGPLIAVGMTAMVALLAILLGIVFSHGKAKGFWIRALTVYAVLSFGALIALTALFKYEGEKNTEQNAIVEAEFQARQKQNLAAFAKYCKDTNRIIHAPTSAAENEAMVVKFESTFTGSKSDFNASQLQIELRRNLKNCEKVSLRYIDGSYETRYDEVKNRNETQIRRFKNCVNEPWTGETGGPATYALILGEQSQKVALQGPNQGTWMSKSSARIVNVASGVTLAEDTLYFLRYSTGEAGCPNGVEQLTGLIADTFSKP